MRTKRNLFWHLRALDPRDILGVAIVIVFAIVLSLWYLVPYRGHNFGFGKDWQCTYSGDGDPVCIKKRAPKPAG